MAYVLTTPGLRARANGLAAAIDWVSDTDAHWQGGGVALDELAGSEVRVIGPLGCEGDGPETEGLPKEFDGGPEELTARPFALYGSMLCAPVGSMEQAQAIASARLAAGVDHGLFEALQSPWAEPGLYQASVEQTAATSPSAALAVAEAALWAAYPGAGVLIVDPGALEDLHDSLDTQAGQLVTLTGHRVALVPGLGQRLYLVPPITGYRSEVVTSSRQAGDLLDRRTNSLYAIAEQLYLLISNFAAGAAVDWT